MAAALGGASQALGGPSSLSAPVLHFTPGTFFHTPAPPLPGIWEAAPPRPLAPAPRPLPPGQRAQATPRIVIQLVILMVVTLMAEASAPLPVPAWMKALAIYLFFWVNILVSIIMVRATSTTRQHPATPTANPTYRAR